MVCFWVWQQVHSSNCKALQENVYETLWNAFGIAAGHSGERCCWAQTSTETPPAPETIKAVVDFADTAFILIASALVLLMTPALAFFYGGLSRSKSVLNTMMMSFAAMGVITLVWVAVGYSIAFGDNPMGAWFGDFSQRHARGHGQQQHRNHL